MIKTAILWALRLGLGGLFVYAGVMKLSDPTGFAVEISNYRLLPEMAPWAAMAMPGVEVAVGALMMAGTRPWLRAASLACIGMMIVFTIAVTQVVARGINIDCGCFGGNSGPVTWVTIVRDLVLLGAAAGVFLMSGPRSPSASATAEKD